MGDRVSLAEEADGCGLVLFPPHLTTYFHPAPAQVSITIVSPGKTFKLRAQTRAEHKLWTAGIKAICPDALFESYGQSATSVSMEAG